MIPYLYVISFIMYTSARVAKPGQRRQVQDFPLDHGIWLRRANRVNERGSPSQVKGDRFRAYSRRGSPVRIRLLA